MPTTAEISSQGANKQSALESTKSQASRPTITLPTNRSPPKRAHKTPIPASALPARKAEGGAAADRSRGSSPPKQKGKPCAASSKQGSEKKEEEYDEDAFCKRYAEIQLGLVKQLEGKTGKRYEGLKKKLERGTRQDLTEAQVRIQQEVELTKRK